MAKSNTFAPVPAEQDDNALDFTSIASRLFEAFAGTDTAIKTADEDHARLLGVARQSLHQRVRDVAEEFPGMTSADFDEHVKRPLEDAFKSADYKAIPTRVAMLKVAFLAYAHEIFPESDKAQSNLQHFVNEEARGRLRDAGVLEASKQGRKAGSTEKEPKDPRKLAATLLSGSPELDKAIVEKRAAMLLWATSNGNWKLLETKLNDMARTLKKTF